MKTTAGSCNEINDLGRLFSFSRDGINVLLYQERSRDNSAQEADKSIMFKLDVINVQSKYNHARTGKGNRAGFFKVDRQFEGDALLYEEIVLLAEGIYYFAWNLERL